ncbi:hypothetical protein LMG22037_04666 [Paraburkholderia phenoliruptrix]|uniref:Uncharacterized protein n=1 Tax=Paraburkholderia phenoliruptrix TaxID=252970 RepID=A0A6J5BYU1_9BURK|nr:hypothetical protein [Paraburkholderia phenoliruptrix]CAB3719824.1 hypothetical protein LMG22037_04666 [Paraburkholderia phenoliruptrix]
MNQTKVIHGITLKPRVEVAPRNAIDPTTPEGRDRLMEAMRVIFEEHREVFEKLAKR